MFCLELFQNGFLKNEYQPRTVRHSVRYICDVKLKGKNNQFIVDIGGKPFCLTAACTRENSYISHVWINYHGLVRMNSPIFVET